MYGLGDRLARTAATGDDAATVMVVDSDPAMLQLVRRCLDGGCTIVDARDADEAVAHLQWAQPDVILVDEELAAAELDQLSWSLSDATTVVTISPDDALTPDDLRLRVDRAIAVSRRMWLNGGLRGRIAA